jgi:hypothetical protein
VFGVFAARASDLAIAPHEAWRGELIEVDPIGWTGIGVT